MVALGDLGLGGVPGHVTCQINALRNSNTWFVLRFNESPNDNTFRVKLFGWTLCVGPAPHPTPTHHTPPRPLARHVPPSPPRPTPPHPTCLSSSVMKAASQAKIAHSNHDTEARPRNGARSEMSIRQKKPKNTTYDIWWRRSKEITWDERKVTWDGRKVT